MLLHLLHLRLLPAAGLRRGRLLQLLLLLLLLLQLLLLLRSRAV